MNRREFIGCTMFASATLASMAAQGTNGSAAASDFELADVPISQLAAWMQSRRHSSRSLVEAYQRRIAAVDRQGPTLRSVIESNPDALAIADALDAERQAKGPRGPLHGVPILLKDNIGTADRTKTTAGSLALEGSIAPADSFVARQLRAAGAVLLGKANLSEWANFRGRRSSSGWSGRGGQTRHPYALDRNPSGSSSGSAVAAAASCCAAAVGTETDGSIVSPSSCCSCVGIKPTVGLVSRSGIIPISRTQDTAGPIARTVEDAAILLSAMVGIDEHDEATKASADKFTSNYSSALRPDGLKGARLGVMPEQSRGNHPAAIRALNDALAAMKAQGATILDDLDMPAGLRGLGEAPLQVLLYEFKAGINAYLARLPASVACRTLADLIAFNEKHADRELAFFGQELFIDAQRKGDLDAPEYVQALAACQDGSRQNGLDAVMDAHRLDAIVSITSGPPGPTDLVYGDTDLGGTSTPAAVAGYPSITVPAAYYHGLPIGISFTGRAFAEATIIRFAYAFEQATKVRRPPTFRPTAELPE